MVLSSHLGIAFCSVTGAMRARKSINIADVTGNIHWRRHLTAGDARMAPLTRIIHEASAAGANTRL
jgi:hypothetical protein